MCRMFRGCREHIVVLSCLVWATREGSKQRRPWPWRWRSSPCSWRECLWNYSRWRCLKSLEDGKWRDKWSREDKWTWEGVLSKCDLLWVGVSIRIGTRVCENGSVELLMTDWYKSDCAFSAVESKLNSIVSSVQSVPKHRSFMVCCRRELEQETLVAQPMAASAKVCMRRSPSFGSSRRNWRIFWPILAILSNCRVVP